MQSLRIIFYYLNSYAIEAAAYGVNLRENLKITSSLYSLIWAGHLIILVGVGAEDRIVVRCYYY